MLHAKRLRANLLLVLTVLFFYPTMLLNAQLNWNSQDWQFRRAITIPNNTGSVLTDHQVQITLDASFDYSKVNNDGSDLRFTSSDEQTLIPFWLEEWNPGGSHAEIWVKVPSIPTSGTIVYMYYTNPSATFPQTTPAQTVELPPTGQWTNVPNLTISGSPGSLLAENMVKDGGTYWQLFTDRSSCNGQLGFAYNTSGDPSNPNGWTWWGDVTIDFSIRSSHPEFSGDHRLDATPGNLLNPYLDCPHFEKGDDGYWYLFYHWITGGNAHSGCGVHGVWSWTPDAYAEIGVARATSITGPYTEIDPLALRSSETEGDGDAWDWARVSEPYVFQREDGKWIMLFMGDKGNYDDPGNPNIYYIEQCSYAVADNIEGPYTKWHNGVDPFIAFGPPGALDAGTIADAHPVKFGDTYYIFYAASPSTFGWKTMYATTDDWETLTKSTDYVYTNDGNSPFRGAILKDNDTYYFSYLGSSSSSPGPFMICTQPATGTVPNGFALYDPNSVFDFYDGFDGSSLDNTKWNGIDPGYSGTTTVANGELQICNSGGFLTAMTAKESFGVGYTLEASVKHSSSGFAGEFGWGRKEPTANWSGPPFNFVNQRIMDLRAINGANFVVDADNADHIETPGDYVSTSVPLDFNNYLVHKIMRVDNNSVKFQLDDNPVTIIDNTGRPTRISTDPLSPWFFILGGSCMNVDWTRVRKYAEPEPVSSVGSEEVYHCYADLSITKVVDNPNPQNGDNVTFTITISNDGPGNSAWAKVTDILSDGLLYVSSSATNGSYDPNTGVWDVGFMNVGTTETLQLTAEVDIFTAAFDFGPASDYNVFVLEDINQPSSDTQGKMAVGRDAYLAGYSVGDQLTSSGGTKDVLVVGRNLTYISGAVYGGNVVYGDSTNLPVPAVSIIDGSLRKDSLINFASAATYLNTLTTQLSNYTANGTVELKWGGIYLNGTDPYLNVFDISGSDLTSSNNLMIDVPNASVVLVNVDGTEISWSGGLTVSGTAIGNVLYNFPDATLLTIQGIDIRGSVLAPKAWVDFRSGVQNGQMICKNIGCPVQNNMGQFNYSLFTGNIPLESDILNVAEVTEADQDDRDSVPGNGNENEDDYAGVTIHVEIDSEPGNDDDWQYVGNFLDGQIVYVLTVDHNGYLLAGTWGGAVYRSTDGGQSWYRINTEMNVGFIWSITVNSYGHLFVGTEQGVFRSLNNGNTWQSTSLELKDVRAIVVDQNGNLFAGVWGFGVYKSTDNGESWTCIGSELKLVNSLAINSNSEIYAATFGNGIFKSIDHGATWQNVNCGYGFVWTLGITFNDYIFAGTYGGGVYRSTDDGDTWSNVDNGLPAKFIYAVSVDAEDKVYVSSWTSGIYATADYGDNWSSLGLGGCGVSSTFVNPSSGAVLAGTKSGSVYMKSDNVISGADNIDEVPQEFLLVQNYPNPFNPATTIKFAIPEAGDYKVSIYNLLGQKVATLLDENLSPGNYSVEFNAEKNASGVYIYQLSGDNVRITKKMILMK